jgi:hypothetical protein
MLPVAGVEEQLTIGASDTSAQIDTEIDQNQNSNSLDRNALDRLPVFDQDYITTLSRFLDSDATGNNGVTLVVNGVEANGPGVTPSAVQSVKINQNPIPLSSQDRAAQGSRSRQPVERRRYTALQIFSIAIPSSMPNYRWQVVRLWNCVLTLFGEAGRCHDRK